MEFALKWVRKHISKFGGNPDLVTIAGESAGGGAVMLLGIARDGNLGSSLFGKVRHIAACFSRLLTHDERFSQHPLIFPHSMTIIAPGLRNSTRILRRGSDVRHLTRHSTVSDRLTLRTFSTLTRISPLRKPTVLGRSFLLQTTASSLNYQASH